MITDINRRICDPAYARMQDAEKEQLRTEAERLGRIILTAQKRFRDARPKSRAAYHSLLKRAERRWATHADRCREAGYTPDGCLSDPVLIPMTDEEKAEFRRWKGEE